MVILIIMEARVAEIISVTFNLIVLRIPTAIAEILVVWMPVRKPASLETVHRAHPKRTTIEVMGKPSVEAIVVIKINRVSPRHGVPPAKRL